MNTNSNDKRAMLGESDLHHRYTDFSIENYDHGLLDSRYSTIIYITYNMIISEFGARIISLSVQQNLYSSSWLELNNTNSKHG